MLLTKTIQQLTAFRAIAGLPWRERDGGSSIRGNNTTVGSPTAAGAADGLGTVLANSAVPSAWTLTMVLSIDAASSLIRTSCSRCRYANTRSSTPFFDQRFMAV